MSSPKVTALRVEGRAPRVLTIDVEDWFHVCGDDFYSDPRRWDSFASRVEKSMRFLFETLERGGHRATLFFLGWIARRYPDLVREGVRGGHEIAVHGDAHRRADEMTPAEFREDLARSRATIEGAAGATSVSYRAAEWSIRDPSQPALEVLASEGFACDASMTTVPYLGRNGNLPGPHRVDFGGESLIEVPPLTGPGFGQIVPMGGAWPFRMFSPDRLRAQEERFREAGLPAVFTFHPWEFDAEHPPMEGLSALVRLVHFYNLKGLPERFEKWLAEDRCVALADVLPRLAA
ncbi:MAG TPA: polysaccharide deacetylase family protein [Thermoanaerobaculia bacterium]|nr:polysaccharide deacetylase family protein [Thermoanaerobaculia bacterium]